MKNKIAYYLPTVFEYATTEVSCPSEWSSMYTKKTSHYTATVTAIIAITAIIAKLKRERRSPPKRLKNPKVMRAWSPFR